MKKLNNKSMYKSKNISVMAVVLFFLLHAQAAVAQWTGPSTPEVNRIYTYSYTTSPFTTPVWVPSSNGAVQSSWLSADRRTAYADVKWTGIGSGTLTIKNGSTTRSILTVNVVCGTMYAPSYSTYRILAGGGSVPGNAYCGPASFRIDATPGAYGVSVKWYASETASTPFHSGTSYTTPTLSASVTYYISTFYCAGSGGGGGEEMSSMSTKQKGTSAVSSTSSSEGCESSRVAVTLTIKAPPAAPGIDAGGKICGTSGTTAIEASSGSNQIRWYNTASEPTHFHTGITYVTPTLTSPRSYFVSAYDASTGCESSRTEAPVTFHPVPDLPSVTSAARCGSGTITLQAAYGANGNVVHWFSAQGAHLATGSQYAPSVSATITFYARSYHTGSGCYSAQQAVTGTVNPIPPAQDPNYLYSGVVYGHGQVIIGSEAEPNTRWYATSTGGTHLAQAYTYETPDLTVETPYYAATYVPATGCESPRTQINAKVLPLISPGTVKKEIIRTGGITQESQIAGLSDQQKITSLSHYDGLLRPIQQIVQKGSPSGKDIVQPIEYDAFGRASKQFLPYVATTTTGVFQSDYKTAQPSFYTATNDRIANDTKPFDSSVYESSPLGRMLEQGGIGQAWQPGTTHTVRASYTFNNGASNSQAEEVRKFSSDGSSTGLYAANILHRTSTVDEQGNTVITFTDPQGSTIATKQQLDETISGAVVNYLETYYIYDDFGRIKYIISPKGVAALRSGGWTLTSSIKDQYVYQFVYDYRGRLVEKKVPGQDWSYMVYDKMNRLVLMQDAMTRPENKWFYLKYDNRHRPVMQGIYQNTTQTTRAAMQTLVDGLYTAGNTDYPESAWHESRGTTLEGYTNVSFPKTNMEVWSVSYYDNHDFDFNGADDYSYTPQGLAGESAQGRSVGMPTGSKRIVQGSSPATWLYTYVFYDHYGQMIQARSNNHLSAAIDNLVTNVYDFEGKILLSKSYHHAGPNATTVINKYEYDTQGRPWKIYQNNNGAPSDQLVAQYEYNELGQLVDKKLHYTGSAFLQSVDYRYTIKGQLESVNNAQLSNDGVKNDEVNDYFGMEYLYNTIETGLNNTAYFNGNISAVKWKGPGMGSGTTDQHSFKYEYDKTSKLETAISQTYSGSAWNKEANAFNEALSYDHNGNIQTLQRNQRKHQLSGVQASYTSETIDNLTYTYASTVGDRLAKVEDATTHTAGFKNGANASNEYDYDGNGNAKKDDNKGISNITYNYLNKPVRIDFTDGRKIEYVYDASGSKLTMKYYPSGATNPQTTTDYVGSFVYENNALSFFGSPEGRVAKTGNDLEYQYSIADHQGNTRVVFTSATPTPSAPEATFEGDSNDKSPEYLNVSNVVSFPSANHTPGGNKVVRMNQSYRTGPAKSLKVYPGDAVDMEVWAYYESASGYGTTSPSLTTLITAVAGAFGGVNGGAGESGVIYDGVDEALTAFGTGGNRGNDAPAAYINYIQFDKDFNVLDAGWTVVPTTANFVKQKISIPTKNIKEEGYMYVYLSYENESNNFVYFDDFKVTHTKTNIIQYNEYYAFGMQANTSWTRDNSKNNYLYNAGSELNSNSGWYETFFRGYDPALGRFMQVDPMAVSEQSTYQYAGNNPVYFNDPLGASKSENIDRWAIVQRIRDLNREYAAAGSWATDYSDNYVFKMGRSRGHATSSNMSAAEFLDAAVEGHGGTWSNGEGTLFGHDTEAYDYGHYEISGYRGWEQAPDGSWVEAVGIQATFVIDKRSAQQGVNLMISFVENTKFINADGWQTAIAKNLSEALQIVQSYTCDGQQINNLVLVSHGNRSGAVFGKLSANGDYLSANVIRGAKRYPSDAMIVNKFNALLAQVGTGGTVVMTACEAGDVLGEALTGNVRTDIGLYLNMYRCNGWNVGNGYIAPIIGSPLSMFGDGWRNVNGGSTSGSGIIINSNGTITID